MSNKNYVKGRRKEYVIRSSLIRAGFQIVQRTAGSHSPIDVFAVCRDPKLIKFIQAKPDNYPQKRIEKLYDQLGWLSGKFKVEFEVI